MQVERAPSVAVDRSSPCVDAFGSMSESFVRVVHFTQSLRRMRARASRDAKAARFFDVFPEAADIEAMPPHLWVPVEKHVAYSEALRRTLGPAGAHEFHRDGFGAMLEGPYFKGVYHTMTRILGISPRSFLRWTPKIWDATFRRNGRVEPVLDGSFAGSLLFSDIAPVCAASDAWIDMGASAFEGFFVLAQTSGVVSVDKSNRSHGMLTMSFRWAASREAATSKTETEAR